MYQEGYLKYEVSTRYVISKRKTNNLRMDSGKSVIDPKAEYN